MREWKFWDWTGYASLFLAVLFLGLAEGVKRMPSALMPDFLDWPIWWFLPLILFVFGSVILFSRAMGWLGSTSPKEKSAFPRWPDPYEPVLVRGKTLINTHVYLDGHSYLECVFENVTFHYNGTTAVQLSHCTIRGSMFFASDNPSVEGTFALMYGLGMIPADTRVIGLDRASNRLTPPIKGGMFQK